MNTHTSWHEFPCFEEYLVVDSTPPGDLLGTLKIKRVPGATRVTVRSRKLKNCILNWKKFVFDLLPISVAAAAVIPTSAAAAAIMGLQALKAAADTLDIELPPEASDVVLHLAALQRDAEPGGSTWISLETVRSRLTVLGLDGSRLYLILRDLERLGVVLLDHTDAQVRIVEDIRFEEII